MTLITVVDVRLWSDISVYIDDGPREIVTLLSVFQLVYKIKL